MLSLQINLSWRPSDGKPETYFTQRPRPSIRRIHPYCIPSAERQPEISRELCAKAKKLAKEMNYRPNPFAMSLRKNAPRIIGVIVPDIVTHFFASILNGIENMAIDNGYFVIITTSHESFEHEKGI